jgi:hypothetical protein
MGHAINSDHLVIAEEFLTSHGRFFIQAHFTAYHFRLSLLFYL